MSKVRKRGGSTTRFNVTTHMDSPTNTWTSGIRSFKQIEAAPYHPGAELGPTVSTDSAMDRLRISQLEQELEVARTDLRGVVAELKMANAEHKTVVEQAMRFLAAACRDVHQPKITLASVGIHACARGQASMSVASLTLRQRQILELVLDGHPSKNIAADLGISQRTVDSHRAAIMRKTGSKSLPALVRTAMAAG